MEQYTSPSKIPEEEQKTAAETRESKHENFIKRKNSSVIDLKQDEAAAYT